MEYTGGLSRLQTDLNRVYEEHAQALFGFLLNLTRDEADTRDVLQDIFMKLAAKPDLLREAREPRAFLLRLAHNMAVDLFRRRTARRHGAAALAAGQLPMFAASRDPDEDSFRRALDEALGKLPEEQRTVVYLKLWEKMTFEAIAATVGVSPNTAASRYRYGLDKLRDLLRPLYEEVK